MGLRRRHLLAGAAGLGAWGRRARAQSPEVLRIGAILPLSGAAAERGRAVADGARIAATVINEAGGVDGRMLQLELRDDAGDPDQAVAALRALAGDGVTLLAGGVLAPPLLAQLPALAELRAVLLACGTGAMRVTHADFSPFVFRLANDDFMRLHGLARLAAERFADVARWGCVAAEDAEGARCWSLFSRLLGARLARAGRQADFAAPVLLGSGESAAREAAAALTRQDVQGLLCLAEGAAAAAFFAELRAAGARPPVQLLGRGGFALARALHGGFSAQAWAEVGWFAGAYPDDPLARVLGDEYAARRQDGFPPAGVAHGFAAVMSYAAAFAAAGAADAGAVIAALEGLTVQTARGPVVLRKADHQALGDVVLVRLAPDAGAAGFVVAESLRYAGAEMAEPAAPGVAFDP